MPNPTSTIPAPPATTAELIEKIITALSKIDDEGRARFVAAASLAAMNLNDFEDPWNKWIFKVQDRLGL